MKKIALFVLSIIALCSFGSCQKNELDSNSGFEKITVIKASLPNSKAALSGKKLTWSEGDKIVVSFTDSATSEFTLTGGAGTVNGTFSGVLPSGKTVSGATARSAELFTTDGKQKYSATQFPYSLVYTGSDLDNLVFEFAGTSYIALTLKGAGTVFVSSIEVNAGLDYILDCGTDGVALSESGIPFYIMLTNEATDAKLEGIVVTTKDGKTMTISVDKAFSEMIRNGDLTTNGHVFPSVKDYKEDLFSGGAGTAAYPFLLADADDIKNFAAYSNGTGVPAAWSSFNFASAFYNVTSNITMGGSDVIAPAFSGTPFVGTFDGCSKTITGLVIDNSAEVPCGLFSSAGENSVIKNLKLTNVTVTSTYVETAAFVGHAEGSTLTALNIDGNASSTITSTANVTPSPANKYGSLGQSYMTVVGGVVGFAYDTDISNCTVAGRPSTKYRLCGGIAAYAGGSTNITNCTIGKYSWVKSGDSLCGGIVGVNQSTGTIDGCKVYGIIESVKAYCGGIVAATNSGTVSKCTVAGATIKGGSGANHIGGICGTIDAGSPVIEKCVVNNTTMNNTSSSYMGFVVGGITGGNKVTISECVVGSKCTMTGSSWGGGVLGAAATKANLGIVIDQCSSYGSVELTSSSAAGPGGIAGVLSGASTLTNTYVQISNCLYEKGTLKATATAPCVGGIVGKSGTPNVNIFNCYTKGATLTDENATSYMAGIAGRADFGTHIFGCYSDVVAGTTLIGASGKKFFPIFYWVPDFAANDNSIQYVYYPNSFTAPGSCAKSSDMESVTPKEGISDFGSSEFLTKMNAAATAYNAAPLLAGTTAEEWVTETGGPTLSTAISDPDE